MVSDFFKKLHSEFLEQKLEAELELKNININHTSKVVEDNQDFPEVKAHFKLFNIDRNYSTTVCLTKKYKKLH